MMMRADSIWNMNVADRNVIACVYTLNFTTYVATFLEQYLHSSHIFDGWNPCEYYLL